MNAVRILRLAAGGDGVSRLDDGRTLFVPRTAPGDLVQPCRLRTHRRFARARMGRLVEPGPDRVTPRCPHYIADDCGGCQLQHLSDDAQRAARQGFVGDALRRLAHVEVADPPIEPAEHQWGYRTKLTLHPSADRRRIGLHPVDRPDDVFDLRVCHITSPDLMALWPVLSRLRHLLPEGLEHLVLRLDRSGHRHVIARVRGGTLWNHAGEVHAALDAAGVGATLWWQPEAGAARAVAGSGEAFPATVFEQIHPAMGDRVRAAAVAAMDGVGGRLVWDLYAGLGETADLLMAAGATVHSVESDARAVAHAARRGTGRPETRVVRHTGRVEDVLGQLPDPAAVITNPPRVGMDARVSAALAERGPARIVYISCDAATLARDIGRLKGYHLAGLRAFDLFPQTAHVETLAVLEHA